jgi:hypothetical protein
VPNYRVRLRWTQDWGTPGHSGHNPHTVDDRIRRAVAAACRHQVRGRNDVALNPNVHRTEQGAGDQRIIVWHLFADDDVHLLALIDRWTGGDEPGHGSFRPNVRLVDYGPDP